MQSNNGKASHLPLEPLGERAGIFAGHTLENTESHIDHLKQLQTYVACQIDEEISADDGTDSAVTRWRMGKLDTIKSVLSILLGFIESASTEQVHWYQRWATERLAELGYVPVFATSTGGDI